MNLYFRLLLLRVLALVRPKLTIWDTARTPFRVMPTDLDILRQGRRRIDQGCRVNGHQAAGSSTVTTMAMNSASAASFPSMKVSPRNL